MKVHNEKLLVLLPGMGAVATTFMAGVEIARVSGRSPFGSVAQMQTIRLGKRSEGRNPLIRDLLPLAPLDKLAFAGWDLFPDNACEAARKAGVLSNEDLAVAQGALEPVVPHQGVFDQDFLRNLDATHVKTGPSKRDLAEQVRQDIRDEMRRHETTRAVMIWTGSTETHRSPAACHHSPADFERGLDESCPDISPSQIYAYAAISEGIAYANGAPNLSADIPALEELALERQVPIAGKDFKTGQTLIKTILAPGFKARMLGVRGWYSTNILGNRDGAVLEDPESFKAKEATKSGVLDSILQPELYPELYADLYHKITINYYPPRGDSKEGWDNIDLFGWLGYPMQLKVDFLCRDSILAAPVVLDLALFLDVAQRQGRAGVQDWLSFYFKSPHVRDGNVAENDLFLQHWRLKNTLRLLAGEEPLTHLSEEEPAEVLPTRAP